ncbi:MAG: VWA domain-containing protein [Candidatus Omnitrophica bacterium]|nr:VWA domain-containing protein [Candidatus Omnitrophota bacterium]
MIFKIAAALLIAFKLMGGCQCYAAVAGTTQDVYEFILDASGSMSDRISGVRKIEMALNALKKTANDHVGRSLMHLRTIGADNQAECSEGDVRSISDLQDLDEAVAQIYASEKGKRTPLAAAMTAAIRDLAQYSGMNKHVILMTDGVDTCGGNPIKVAQSTAALDANLKVHVVGIRLDSVKLRYMQSVAGAADGEFKNISDESELTDFLQSVSGDSDVNHSEDRVLIGGSSVIRAARIESSHFVLSASAEPLYYSVFTRSNQAIQLNTDPTSVSTTFYDKNGVKLTGSDKEYLDLDGSGCVFSLQSKVSEDLEVTGSVVEVFDKMIGLDASAGHPVELPFKQSLIGHIGLQDAEDVYLIKDAIVKTKETVVRLQFLNSVYFNVVITDSSGRLTLQRSGSGRNAVFKIPPEKTQHLIYLSMGRGYSTGYSEQYRILWEAE